MKKSSFSARTRRLVSAWFPYEDGGSWARLAPRANVIGSISIFGKEPDRQFMDACEAAGIGTLKLVGGNADAFDTRAHASATIAEYVRLCKETGYGGIDLDFEHIDVSFRRRYSDFMRALSSELHAIGRRLSICIFAIDPDMYERIPDLFYDPAVVGEVCDEVRVMCYDMYFAYRIWYGPTSTRLWARNGMRYWRERIPPQKLIMGLPAYSNEYDLTPGSGFGRQQGCDSPAGLVGGDERQHDVEKLWLPYDGINIYRYLDARGHVHLFFASDGESTRVHLGTVDELDIPGISFWHYGSMSEGIWRTVLDWLG
jgi:spore germination protein YaaH